MNQNDVNTSPKIIYYRTVNYILLFEAVRKKNMFTYVWYTHF